MQISKHLTLEELTFSATAVKMGIQNVPTPNQINNLKIVAEKVFEPMREHFGIPIHINSGFRILNLNVAIGGSGSSQHCGGQALDLSLDKNSKITKADLYAYILNNLDYDQLIWELGTSKEPDWVHVSYVSKEKNRRQALKAVKLNGKTVYQPMVKPSKKK
jgi:hypothetical protein